MAKKKTTKKAASSTPKKRGRPRKAAPTSAPAKKARKAKKAPPPTKAPEPSKKPVAAETKAPEPDKKKRRAKKGSAAKAAPSPKGNCGKGKRKGKCKTACASGTCTKPQLDGRSLLDRARNCKSLDECHKFIAEFNEAVEQANEWLDDMHAQALSAEQTRDMYGEQISDLLEAIDIDRGRIAELEADLKNERAKAPNAPATKAVLDTLAELRKEVKSLRSELERLLEGRGLTAARRQQARQTARGAKAQGSAVEGTRRRGRPRKEAREDARERPAESTAVARRSKASGPALEGRPMRRRAQQAPGAFPKYSVLRGAACSLGVGKYGYPPEVCAPASFSRTEAAEILGTYAQNKYAGLAKWAVITGLPIDDIAVPLVPMKPRGVTGDTVLASKPPRQRAAKVARAATPRTATKKAAGSDRSNKQILDQVLLTVARI